MPEVDHAAVRDARKLRRWRKKISRDIWAYCRENANSLDSELAIGIIMQGFDTEDKMVTTRVLEQASSLKTLSKQCSELRTLVKKQEERIAELTAQVKALSTSDGPEPATERPLE